MFGKLLGKLGKGKGEAVPCEVSLRVSGLSPWPAASRNKRLLVKWDRGAKARAALSGGGGLAADAGPEQRTGTTKAVLGADDPTQRAPGKGFHLKYDFRETVAFPATLYKARRAAGF